MPQLKIHKPPPAHIRKRAVFQKYHKPILAEFYHHGPMTDEELSLRTGNNTTNARWRRGELLIMGMLQFSGTYRHTTHGRRAKIWSITPTGKRKAINLFHERNSG